MAGSADEPDACANSMCFPLGEDGVAGDVAVSARAAPANHSTPNEKMIARANALAGLMDPLGFTATSEPSNSSVKVRVANAWISTPQGAALLSKRYATVPDSEHDADWRPRCPTGGVDGNAAEAGAARGGYSR